MMCTERKSSNQTVVNAVMMVAWQFVNYKGQLMERLSECKEEIEPSTSKTTALQELHATTFIYN